MSELREHLTEIEGAKLKPVNILQAAVADLRLLERKREGKRCEEELYSFVGRQVRYVADRGGGDPIFLIALAYWVGLPGATDKPSTQRIYNDKALLLDTLIELLLDRKQGRPA